MSLGNAARGVSRPKTAEEWYVEEPATLNPTLSDNPYCPRLVSEQRAMIGSTQYMIDSNAIIGQREKSTAIEDWHAAKCCLAFNDQTAARRED